MNRKTVLFICCFLFIGSTYSQKNSSEYLDSLVDKFISELHSKRVDTICIYRDYQIGAITKSLGGGCIYENKFIPTYIFWKEKGKTYLTKKDNCYDYDKIEFRRNDFWEIYFAFKNEINNEEIKDFEHVEIVNGKKEIYKSLASHSHYRSFEILLKKSKYYKFFDDYDLQKRSSGNTNINFEYNLVLKSKILIDELERMKIKIENENMLKSTKRE